MTTEFNADEIFEMAEEIERKGVRFYRRAASVAPEARTRELLLKLASMEEDHQRIFASMRKDLAGHEWAETVYDPQGEVALYLRAMTSGKVFDVKTAPSTRLTGKETMEEILHIAIGLEKDSIIFYLGIKDMVPENLGREQIDRIIKEEMSHITTLNEELATLSK
jgi:rubrerythrin